MDHITPDFLVLGLGWYAVFLIAITCHEAAHAWAAKLLGDPTAYYAGQVTLNPGPHIEREPLGTILMPVISYLMSGFMLGWASAPYDPYWGAQYPRRALLMALAGPAANLVLVIIAGILLRIGFHAGWFEPQNPLLFLFGDEAGLPGTTGARIMMLLAIMFSLNLMLCVFNLIPLPPLDGSAIWPLLLNPRQLARYEEFRSQPSFVLLGIIVASSLFPRVFFPVAFTATDLLLRGL
jgi:Zn-dependent protease